MGITLRRAITVLEWRFGIKKVLLTGGSQWGISLFLPASADSRIAGIVPSAMHTLLDMKAYLEIVSQGDFTYGLKLVTPRLAKEMLSEILSYPQFNELSPVNLNISAPVFIIGGSGDEFYPLQGFNLVPLLSPAQKYLYIMPNISHGFENKKADDSRRAFFRSIISGAPSFESEIKVISEKAVGDDLIIQANVRAKEQIKDLSLFWACDNGNGSFNDERWQRLRGEPKGSDYEFTIKSGKKCSHPAYFIELKLSHPLNVMPQRAVALPTSDKIYLSSLPVIRP